MKLEEKVFTPKDFIEDLIRIKSFNDNRVLVWYCNLYTEHFVKLIYKGFRKDCNFGNCSNCFKSLEPSYLSKVSELSENKIIDKSNNHHELLEMIYKSRNIAGHELDLKEAKIIEKILKTFSNAKMEDPQGYISKILNNLSPWQKFEVATVIVFYSLYEKYQKMCFNPIDYKLIFETDKTYTQIWPKFISSSDVRY